MAATPLLAQWTGEKEVVRLWPGSPPDRDYARAIAFSKTPGRNGQTIKGIADPVMIVRRPARPNGMGMLLIPGGAYHMESFEKVGVVPATYFNQHGITAFILAYRLPGEGWTNQADVPLQDAQRAMRLMRANAAKYGLAPDRLGVIGFSAGGHLAGSLATRFDEKVYALSDPAEQVSARPDLAALMYPVITMCPPYTHKGSRNVLIGADPSAERCKHYSVDQRVTAATPPVFLAQAGDDPVVPVQNSILMYQAMLAQHRPVAMHLFEKGGHGFSTDLPKTDPRSAWPELLLNYAASHGFPVA